MLANSTIFKTDSFLRRPHMSDSEIFTTRFSSILLRAAIPVRHDIAPAREWAGAQTRGHVGGAEDQVADGVAAAVAAPCLRAVMRSCFPFSRVRYSSCSSSTFQDCWM